MREPVRKQIVAMVVSIVILSLIEAGLIVLAMMSGRAEGLPAKVLMVVLFVNAALFLVYVLYQWVKKIRTDEMITVLFFSSPLGSFVTRSFAKETDINLVSMLARGGSRGLFCVDFVVLCPWFFTAARVPTSILITPIRETTVFTRQVKKKSGNEEEETKSVPIDVDTTFFLGLSPNVTKLFTNIEGFAREEVRDERKEIDLTKTCEIKDSLYREDLPHKERHSFNGPRAAQLLLLAVENAIRAAVIQVVSTKYTLGETGKDEHGKQFFNLLDHEMEFEADLFEALARDTGNVFHRAGIFGDRENSLGECARSVDWKTEHFELPPDYRQAMIQPAIAENERLADATRGKGEGARERERLKGVGQGERERIRSVASTLEDDKHREAWRGQVLKDVPNLTIANIGDDPLSALFSPKKKGNKS